MFKVEAFHHICAMTMSIKGWTKTESWSVVQCTELNKVVQHNLATHLFRQM